MNMTSADGHEGEAQLLLDTGSPLSIETALTSAPETDDAAFVQYLKGALSALVSSRGIGRVS